MEVAMSLRWMNLMLVPVALISCAQPSRSSAGETSEPGDRTRRPGVASIEYWRDVKPILERRCVVCHGCYDAPCQLNLTAFEGVTRGAHKKKVYDTTRLISAEPTRLFHDARSVAEWREKGFCSAPGGAAPAGGGQPPAGGVARPLAV